MSEEEKPTETAEAPAPAAAAGEETKEEESTAHFEPVVSLSPSNNSENSPVLPACSRQRPNLVCFQCFSPLSYVMLF